MDLCDLRSLWLIIIISIISILLIFPHVTEARGGNHFSSSKRVSPRPASSSDGSLTDLSRFRFPPNQRVKRAQFQHSETRVLGPAAGVSCTGPDHNTCGTLTLYTCERVKRSTGQSGVDAVSGSCRVDEYARLERANLLRCRANLTELRSRFSFNQSIIGIRHESEGCICIIAQHTTHVTVIIRILMYGYSNNNRGMSCTT